MGSRGSSGSKKLKIGMIFPGQGSQFLGMGKGFYNSDRMVQEYFEDASACLGQNFVKLCFASSDRVLQGNIETQTAVFLVSTTIQSILEKKYGIKPDLVAGHSLGEYSAVVAAGGMSFTDALYLLNKRAMFMNKAISSQDGAMLAVMDFPEDKLEHICSIYNNEEGLDKVAQIGCYNSPTQLVVSGSLNELELVSNDVKMLKGKAQFLPIDGAFHSKLLYNAEREYASYLLKVDFNKLSVPLVSNVTAKKIQDPEAVKLSIVGQTSLPVRWWDSMQHFKDMDIIVEIGPNDKLSKMLSRVWPDKPIISINKPSDADRLKLMIDSIRFKYQCCQKQET